MNKKKIFEAYNCFNGRQIWEQVDYCGHLDVLFSMEL